jgi:hypothetical protein
MLNFDFKKSSRKCFESDREFQPSEVFYSALVEVDDSTERRDYGDEHWEGPPDGCIGWWKSRVPEKKEGKVYWAPKNVLLAYFQHVHADANSADVAYVTALLLVQKKILSIGDSEDASILLVHDRQAKETFEVNVPEISPKRLTEIQTELSERLFMDQPIEEGEFEVED